MADLTREHAVAILKFLSTAQIIGGDCPAFMECIGILRMIATAEQKADAPVNTSPTV